MPGAPLPTVLLVKQGLVKTPPITASALTATWAGSAPEVQQLTPDPEPGALHTARLGEWPGQEGTAVAAAPPENLLQDPQGEFTEGLYEHRSGH